MKVHIVTTGGTIEKVYSERSGQVENVAQKIDRYLQSLRLRGMTVEVTPLMNKDSLLMTDEDRDSIYESVREKSVQGPVIVTHGTDTMVQTGQMLKRRLTNVSFPVILTGAMSPLGFERSDGLQNLTESLLAARIVQAGVWIVFHNQVHDVDRVRKDHENACFTSQ